MCGCERHRDPSAPCSCDCDHKGLPEYIPTEDFSHGYVAGQNFKAGEIVTVKGDNVVDGSMMEVPRLKRFIYRHAHKCSHEGEFFTYRPGTQGSVMFPIQPWCIEAEVELMRVRVEDDV